MISSILAYLISVFKNHREIQFITEQGRGGAGGTMLLKCGKRSPKNIFSHFLLQSKFWCFSALNKSLKILLPFLSGLFFRIQFPVFLSRPAISRLLNHFSFPWIKSWKLCEGYIFETFWRVYLETHIPRHPENTNKLWRENFKDIRLVVSLPPPFSVFVNDLGPD